MSLDRVTQAIRTRLAEFTGLNARIEFDFGDGTALVIDATTTPPVLADATGDVACTIGLSIDDLEEMIAGTLSPTFAFMTGKLKITGSMGLAMKVAALIED